MKRPAEVEGHKLTTGRYSRGKGPVRGMGERFGTSGRCSCREWEARWNNAPPSRGGVAAIRQLHRAHLDEVAPS